ncbi:GTPase HflX, partial [Bacillus halotolerans]
VILQLIDSSKEEYTGHEKTVLRLLEELEADDIPVLTAYNKRDQKLPDFIPSVGKNHIMVSARFEEDAEKFKEAIQRYLRQELLTPFEAQVPASEGKLLSRIKSETMVDRFHFNEENEQYDISGYVQEEQSIIGELKKYM